jgi:hypothetical protein
MSDFYRDLNIPKSCHVGNTVFKKLFYDSGDLNKTDKELFTEQIDKIIWTFCFKPDTINIMPYHDEQREYTEMEIIEVRLHSDGKIKRIAKIIMRTIPYPMLLVFSLDNKIQLWAAHQRISLADQSRNTIEEFIFTDWVNLDKLTDKDKMLLQSLQLQNLSHVNYYRLYSDIVDRLITYNASKLTDGYIEGKDADDVKVIYDKIAGIDQEIEKLRVGIKKESQLNRRVEMNIEIKKLESGRKELLGGLV